MRLTRFWLFALLSIGACVEAPAQQPSDLGAFASAGCTVCHGAEAQGTAAGPSLAGTALDYAAFAAAVRQPTRTMPAYSEGALPGERLMQMFTALQALPAPSLPGGSVEAGRRVFAANGCYSCHANEAQGGMHGPRLGPDPISFARFSWYVRHPSRTMPPYSPVVMSDDDLANVYAFLAAQPEPPPLDEIPLLAP